MLSPVNADSKSIAFNRLGQLAPSIVAVLTGWFLVFFDTLDGIPFMGDVDDTLRRLQIQTLFETGNWFDRTLPAIQMPEAYISPWSRLVDLPYLTIGWVFTSFLDAPAAFDLAYTIWPPVLLSIFCILVVDIQKRILPGGHVLSPLHVVASLALMTIAVWEFTPGRIDHHNVQLVLSLLIFYGLVLWTAKGGILAAVAIVLSVAVGLELLPLVAFAMVAICLCWAANRDGGDIFLKSLGAGIVATTPIAGLLLIGPLAMSQTACDAFSAPYIVALMGFGLIAVASPVLFIKSNGLLRLAALSVAGVALVGTLAVIFPLCLNGPYHMIDPLSRELWLNRVSQEQSVLSLFQDGYFSQLALLAVLVVVGAVVAPLVWRQWQVGKTGIAIVFGLSVLCLVLTCLQTRYIRFPVAFILLFVPLVFLALEQNLGSASRWLMGATSAVTALGLGLHFAVPVRASQPEALDFLSFYDCKNPDLSSLAALPPGRIMAPASLGLFMADRLPPGFTVAGVSFHRASPAIKRILETFIVNDSAARKLAMKPFDYVAVCRIGLPAYISDPSLFTTLTRGKPWPGLEHIETGTTSRIRLFKIDHARLE